MGRNHPLQSYSSKPYWMATKEVGMRGTSQNQPEKSRCCLSFLRAKQDGRPKLGPQSRGVGWMPVPSSMDGSCPGCEIWGREALKARVNSTRKCGGHLHLRECCQGWLSAQCGESRSKWHLWGCCPGWEKRLGEKGGGKVSEKTKIKTVFHPLPKNVPRKFAFLWENKFSLVDEQIDTTVPFQFRINIRKNYFECG